MSAISGRSFFLESPVAAGSVSSSIFSGSASSAQSTPTSSRPCTPPSTLITTPDSQDKRGRMRMSTKEGNPVTQVAHKLNEMTAGLFACGAEGAGTATLNVDDAFLNDIYQKSLRRRRRKGSIRWNGSSNRKGSRDSWHHPSSSALLDFDVDDEEEDKSEESGIEVDTENSLRPAYELCRV